MQSAKIGRIERLRVAFRLGEERGRLEDWLLVNNTSSATIEQYDRIERVMDRVKEIDNAYHEMGVLEKVAYALTRD